MWQVIGASSRGTSHIRQGLPCQDAHQYVTEGTCLVASVADGLGSAAKADEGARIAVNAAVTYLLSHLAQDEPDDLEHWQQLMRSSHLRARERLEEYAREAGQPLRSYATTLLTLVVTPGWLAIGHIGDGAIVAQYDDGRLETVSPPVRGEYVNSVTPLTVNDPLPHIRLRIEPAAVARIALFTDGIQSLCINEATGNPYGPFFMPLFEDLGQDIDVKETSHELALFLDSERICARTDDDKTLILGGKVENHTGISAEDYHPSEGSR